MLSCENIAIFTAMLYSMNVDESGDDSKQCNLAACCSTLGRHTCLSSFYS
jgi:hypothetical protein